MSNTENSDVGKTSLADEELENAAGGFLCAPAPPVCNKCGGKKFGNEKGWYCHKCDEIFL